MKYQFDDFIYDIEIRKNLFVLTQYYPLKHKFIVSFMEGMNQYLDQFQPEEDHYQYGDLVTDYQKGQQALNFLSQNRQLNNIEFLQKMNFIFQHSKQDANQLISQTIHHWSHPFNISPETKKFMVDYINHENPSLIRTKNNNYEFENLANPDDFAKFAARFGLVSNWDSAIQGWTDEHIKTPIVKNGPTGLFNNLNILNFTNDYSNSINDYYYPVKDLDLIAHQLPKKANTGLRIGYNSKSYDETMVAHFLGESYLNTKTFLNTTPEAWQYFKDNYATYQQTNWQQLVNGTNIPLQQALQLIMLRDFIQHIYNLLPSNLANFNNVMFDKGYMPGALNTDGRIIKHAYEASNRFVDVMTLLPQPMPLKQLAGMFGFQIKESSSNEDPNQEQPSLKDLTDVIAYNISDVYVTHQVFQLEGFQSTYDQRLTLNHQFAMLNWKHDDNDKQHKLAVAKNDPKQVRFDRITTNTTNPRIMENILAPYPNTKLVDNPVVSFMYPAKEVAEEKGIEQFDALEDTMKFAKENIPNGEKIFKPIYDYYDQFRGRNFNQEIKGAIDHGYKVTSWNDDKVDAYTRDLKNVQDHANVTKLTSKDDLVFNTYEGKTKRISHQDFITKTINSLPIQSVFGDYMELDKNGNSIPSRGYYKATIGGIHGAEYNRILFQADLGLQAKLGYAVNNININDHLFTEATPDELLKQYQADYREQYANQVKKLVNNLIHKIDRKTKKRLKETEQPFTKELRSPFGEDIELNTLITFHKDGSISVKATEPIERFSKKKIKVRYEFTSTGKARHQDFSSYYPTLTVLLRIAVNADGEDQYKVIYLDRLHNKRESKNPKNSPEVRREYKDKQKPQKLLLNSLTGIADAKGNMRSKVKVNNKILQMRITGQLFAWRIGQALALAGAKIVSTNTDGLYTQDIDEKTNDRIVKEQTDHLLLDVGPEEIDNFISKDANNRIEYTDHKVGEAKGGTLTAWAGPNWTKRLSHPALSDRILTEYLTQKPDAANQEFDRDFARKLLYEFKDETLAEDNGQQKFLNFVQWIMRSNHSSKQFIFKGNLIKNDDDQLILDEDADPNFLEITNRVFMIDQEANKKLNHGENWSLFKAAPQTVSTMSGVKTHITDALKTAFHGHINADILDHIKNWKADVDPADFIMNDVLIKNYLKDFNRLDDELKRQELYVNNDPIAEKVIKRYLSKVDLYDEDNGIYGKMITSLNPKNSDKRYKIIDLSLAKINDFPDKHPVYINNRALADYPADTISYLIDHLDYEAYLDIVQNKFEKSWQNAEVLKMQKNS